mmetsp:Transcript_54951/g.158066  ORF Transcript_54951/g.158066 Transcript_54951/m.158066 type:complete len:131 (-) Transcript_54951:17-409(-)
MCGWRVVAAVLFAAVPSVGMAAARICDEDHTPAQTVGGVFVGAALAKLWALSVTTLLGADALARGEPAPWAMVLVVFAVGLPMFVWPLPVKVARHMQKSAARRLHLEGGAGGGAGVEDEAAGSPAAAGAR